MLQRSAARPDGIYFALVIISNVSTWTEAAGATRAWLSDTAHPATNATIKVAVLIANNVLAI